MAFKRIKLMVQTYKTWCKRIKHMVLTYNIIGHLENIFYHNNGSNNPRTGTQRRMGNSPTNYSIFTFFFSLFHKKKWIYILPHLPRITLWVRTISQPLNGRWRVWFVNDEGFLIDNEGIFAKFSSKVRRKRIQLTKED